MNNELPSDGFCTCDGCKVNIKERLVAIEDLKTIIKNCPAEREVIYYKRIVDLYENIIEDLIKEK